MIIIFYLAHCPIHIVSFMQNCTEVPCRTRISSHQYSVKEIKVCEFDTYGKLISLKILLFIRQTVVRLYLLAEHNVNWGNHTVTSSVAHNP